MLLSLLPIRPRPHRRSVAPPALLRPARFLAAPRALPAPGAAVVGDRVVTSSAVTPPGCSRRPFRPLCRGGFSTRTRKYPDRAGGPLRE
ncbi:hypothetical protein CP973_23410 [Streptomyces albofaciens JCM 4342]|uniref:hypothetical protein n=1 Tax=Streptomyces albofaciens TaxID=66866 RepID=UPI00123B240B|nr:hypothetical protein [Streptomyces albofaciens]KAA6212369.1 hypothetical protein CP973_23410 [Streptomyces albofaciens JCM 4342]